jgi:hypothetical protein
MATVRREMAAQGGREKVATEGVGKTTTGM